MKKTILFLLMFILIFADSSYGNGEVTVLSLNGVINPIMAQHVTKGIDYSKDSSSECLIILMNTPGGLASSMRNIIEKILASKIPIVVYVSPQGAHAASAGAFIGVSAHVLAMSPGTNIGAAHPVNLTGRTTEKMDEKMTNDAAAYISSIATKRGKNKELAEKFVRQNLSLTEKDAVESNIADYIANDLNELLKKIDGVKIEDNFGSKTLKTKNLQTNFIEMAFHEKFLHAISDPNIAYILLSIGVLGIVMEFFTPGGFIGFIIGGISLIMALFSLGNLPVNLAGVLLIVLSTIFFVAEIKIVSYGALTIGGIISLILGAMILYSEPNPYIAIKVSVSVIFATVFVIAVFLSIAITVSVKSLRSKVKSGIEGIIGEEGIAKTNLNPFGIVIVSGEDWNAESKENVEKGERIIVMGVHGLRLEVKKLTEVHKHD